LPAKGSGKTTFGERRHNFCRIPVTLKPAFMLKIYILRALLLIFALGGLLVFGYYVCTTFPDLDSGIILCITVPDMLFFYLAYKTYPEQSRQAGRRQPFR
jgi:hypothetical protein